VLTQGQSTVVNVTFAPTVAGALNTNMTVTHNASNSPTTTVALTGIGSQANVLGQDATDLNFGDVAISTLSNGIVTVTNLGTGSDPALSISALNITGTDAADFAHSE